MIEPASSVWRYHSFNQKLPTLLSAALFAFVVGSARAGAEKVDLPGLDAFMQSRLLHDLVQGALQKVPPVVFQKCPGLVSDKTTLQVLKPMSFNADGGAEVGRVDCADFGERMRQRRDAQHPLFRAGG